MKETNSYEKIYSDSVDETKQLQEKIKELDCLFSIAKIVENKDLRLAEVFQQITSLLPASWQHTDVAIGKIVYDGKKYVSKKYKHIESILLADIIVHNEKRGQIGVLYTEKKPDEDEGPFLKEERLLLNTIAERLGHIIEQRHYEEELQHHAHIFKSISDAIIVTTTDYTIKSINAAAEGIYNIKMNAAAGLALSDLVTIQYLGTNREQVLAHVQQSAHWEGNTLHITNDGAEHFIYSKIQIVNTIDGDKEIIMVNRDVSEKLNAEKEFEQARKKTDEANLLKASFIANMSHEIRTPLNAILGFNALLKREYISNRDRVEYARNIELSANHLLEILNDIIELSKIEAGFVEINMIPIDLHFIMQQFKSEYVARIKSLEKDIKFKLDFQYTESAYNIFSDLNFLRQILGNLLSNALKFTSSGTITLGYNMDDETKVMEIYVEDTGIGIDKDHVTAVFDRFMQVDNGDKKKYSGSGLGLTISKKMARLLGGDVNVFSEFGKGSRFSLHLPCEFTGQPMISGKQKQLEKFAPFAYSETILLIERDPVTLLFLEKMIGYYNIPTISASEMKEAGEILKNNSISMILLDITFPEATGLDAVRNIRSDGYSMPIIAQTNHPMSDELAAIIDAGCDDYIPKPVNEDHLMYLVYKYLSKK